jgi:hypothetical protein
MANICRTEIKIKANKAAIKDFALRYEACNDGSYPNEQDSPHIIDEFGAQAELLIDRIGSKWIKMYDPWPYWEEGMTEYDFALESAWYSPSDMMNEIYRQLKQLIQMLKWKEDTGMKDIVQLGCLSMLMGN